MRRLFAIFFALAALTPRTVQAWGEVGHRAVAAVAWQRLSPEARRDLRALAPRGQRRFGALATWADEVRGTDAYRWTGPLHYLNVERGSTDVGRPEACDDDDRGCVLSAIERFESVLADSDAPVAARREAVAFLLHFVGDIHQPLHCGYGDDRGGNDAHVQFFGEATNLHRVWDTQLLARDGARWRPLARRLTAALDEADARTWTDSLSPQTWAQESLELVRSDVYPTSQELGEAYQRRALPIAERRLAMAGVRLAALLERALESARTRAPTAD